jgi:hypothetical protein
MHFKAGAVKAFIPESDLEVDAFKQGLLIAL